MATKKNMAVMIATIKSIYPYYAKDTNIEVLAKTWLLLLQDYDDKIINKALLLCIKEYETPPTPAHIIKMIEQLNPKQQPTKLWAQLVSALKKIDKLQDGWQYFSQEQKAKKRKECIEIYNSMPQEVRDYVGSYAEMVRMSGQVFDNTFLSIEKTRFLKFIPEIRKEQETKLIANNNLLLGEYND